MYTINCEEAVFHEPVNKAGSRPIAVDENIRLYNKPGIIHI
jgi:hypothetical protein